MRRLLALTTSLMLLELMFFTVLTVTASQQGLGPQASFIVAMTILSSGPRK